MNDHYFIMTISMTVPMTTEALTAKLHPVESYFPWYFSVCTPAVFTTSHIEINIVTYR